MKEKIKTKVRDLLDDLIEEEILKWPPDCIAILFQPERPKEENNLKEN